MLTQSVLGAVMAAALSEDIALGVIYTLSAAIMAGPLVMLCAVIHSEIRDAKRARAVRAATTRPDQAERNAGVLEDTHAGARS